MGLDYRVYPTMTGAHAKIINQRLISWELTDADGHQSDQLKLVVDAEGLPGLPKEGERIGLILNYQGVPYDKGEFLITRINAKLFPMEITIVATAAPFQVKDDSAFKKRRSQSYEQYTLGVLFENIVKKHGFLPRVDPALAKIIVSHVDQTDETDMSFITRLARQYDAVAKPINKLYVLAKKGQLKSISGKKLSTVKVGLPANNQPTNHNFINAHATLPSRGKYNGVVTLWWDGKAAKEREVKIGKPAYKKLRHLFDSEAKAREIGERQLRKVGRKGVNISLEMPANPLLVAEGLIELDGSFPAHMQGKWSIERVMFRGNKSMGCRCSVSAVGVSN
ncbi:contractile injection system protein, VgrG/Pvc8 family [Spartinivicinus ruber]|uniref:contractile injection system protein, VgrG/Pvc8 family n=1 Tax=Spartinivicinus ruber TaxID=2683272 RepID=UPI0013D8AD12|nr:contractile injection system protein, VgrG/Pvc8 family [Spartinivicinus ruber]